MASVQPVEVEDAPAVSSNVTNAQDESKKGVKVEKKGYEPDRRCRDVFWLIFYILFFCGFIAVTIISVQRGKIMRLIYANDYEGNTCGVDGLKNKKNVVYPRLEQDIILQADKISSLSASTMWDLSFFGVCVETCPRYNEWICKYDVEEELAEQDKAAVLNACVADDSGTNCERYLRSCWNLYLAMEPVFFRCIPVYIESEVVKEECLYPEGVYANSSSCRVKKIYTNTTEERTATTTYVYDRMNQARGLWMQYIGDLMKTYPVIVLFGVGVALVLALVVTTILRCCTKLIIWLVLILIVLMSIGFTLFAYFKGGILRSDDVEAWIAKVGTDVATSVTSSEQNVTLAVPSFLRASEENQMWFRIGAYVMTAVSLIIIIIVIVIRNKVNKAALIISEASMILFHNPLLILVPIIITILFIGVFAGGVYVSAQLMSAGKITTNDFTSQLPESSEFTVEIEAQFKDVKDDDVTKYVVIYVVFWVLWTVALIQAFGLFSIAMTVRDEYYNGKASCCSPCKGVGVAFRYYFGTLAFGSFLIAFLQLLRIILEYVDRKTKAAQAGNKCIACLFRCLRCCLCCLEKCLRYLSKCAYTIVATDGTSFCVSAKEFVKTFLDNTVVISMISVLSTVFFFLGKALIMIASTWLAFLYLDNQSKYQEGGEEELSSYWLTLVCIFVAAFAICTAFFYVYDMVIDAVMIIICRDKGEKCMIQGLQKRIYDITGKPINTEKK